MSDVVDIPLGTIQKVAFTCEPHADAVAYVCLPRDVSPPFTFVICLQGHSTGMHNSIRVQREDENRPHPVEGDRDFGLECLRRGLAAVADDVRAGGRA